MRKVLNVVMCIPFLLCLGIPNALAQDEDEESMLEFIFGPRVGVSWVIATPEQFNESVQQIFPDETRAYFPIFTQFGINLEQRIRLGTTKSHFAFQEVLVIGGLDQNIVLPSLNFLIGFRSHAGLEFGLGPNISMSRSAGDIEITVSVVYAVGWTFFFQNVFVPVNIAVVPTPSDGHPRITFLTGFNFKLK
ncbi:MAG: hypothetical protein FVQ80_16350 [Planctomycetes bacterium]|nr:hypothetical protein [Planctomycetota bacterium]